MKKALIAGIAGAAVVFIAIGAVGATYIYASSQKPHEILRKNVEVFSDLNKLDSFTIESNDNGKVKLQTGIDLFDNTQASSIGGEKTTRQYVVKGDKLKVTTTSNTNTKNDNPRTTTEEKQADKARADEFVLFLFRDKNKWDEIINKKDYKLESVNENNESYWKFTVKSKTLSDYLANEIKSSFTKGITQGVGSNPSIDLSKAKIDLKGGIQAVILVNKKNNQISQANVKFLDDMNIDFGVTAETLFGGVFGSNNTNTGGSSKNIMMTIQKDFEENSKISDLIFNDKNFKIEPKKVLGIF